MADRAVRETERKYDAPECLRLVDPGAQLRMNVVERAGAQLSAVYFDTADLRLAQAGITLRCREGGSDAGWHLKLPAGADTRDEVREPLGPARTQPPAALVALVRVYVREADVLPLARLVTRRRRWLVADDGGQELAELVEDRVAAERVGDRFDSEYWRELEVELAADVPSDVLDDIERALLTWGASRSAAPSKLARLLGDDVAAPQHVSLTCRSSAREVLLEYLGAQVRTLRAADVRVRQDAPDAVHRLRVTARRIRSVLQAFGSVLDRDATRELLAELRWVGQELAAARDSEVMLERFDEMVQRVPEELVLGPVKAQLTRRFAPEQAATRSAAIAALDSDRYLRLHDALDALLADPPLRAAAGRCGRQRLTRSANKAADRMHRRFQRADRVSGDERDRALHEARKAAKRARYAAETLEPVLGKAARRPRRRIKKLQSLLGDHHDTVVARPVLRELAVAAHRDGGNGFTFGLMHGAETARAAELDRRVRALTPMKKKQRRISA